MTRDFHRLFGREKVDRTRGVVLHRTLVTRYEDQFVPQDPSRSWLILKDY